MQQMFTKGQKADETFFMRTTLQEWCKENEREFDLNDKMVANILYRMKIKDER